MTKTEIITFFDTLKKEINGKSCYDFNSLLYFFEIDFEEIKENIETLKSNLEVNNHDINQNIIIENEKYILSKYAIYSFLDKIDKNLFKNMVLYTTAKFYFYTKDFDWWSSDKKIIDDIVNGKFLNIREIWDCKLWVNIWWEANGKWKHMRPVLILKQVWSNFLVIPLTKHGKKETEDYWNFYYDLSHYFNNDSFAMLTQIRTIDKKRCVKLIKTKQWEKTISEEDYNIIIEKIKNLYFSNNNKEIIVDIKDKLD